MNPRRPDSPRGVLNVRARPPGAVVHERFLPSPALAPFIEHYWSVRWDLQAPYLAETLSHPSVHILFEKDRAQVGGVRTRRFRRWLRGKSQVFGIKFRPAAFHPVLGAPVSRITHRVLGLRTVFGRKSDALKRAVLAEPDISRRILLAEQFLIQVLPPMPEDIARLRDLVERLAKDSEIVRVEQVAQLAKLNVRTLQRRFQHAVGVSPKWVIQRYRLHEVAERLSTEHEPDMGMLAQQVGYFDQSHFIRDFKAMVGCSPGAYWARNRASD